ncbi:hypothetical protein L3X38_009719 [Prunus dulcis]|uniref:Uncharacterized protein n=1 Tax=Prunus dulcis TaxID=3755 RepID=A0AAD4ZDJ4_PRUDU|nr:hypothetical protein L3X38_009719 [Prunus dulcis]
MKVLTYELLFSLFGNVNAPYEEGNMLSQVDAAERINAIEMDMARYAPRVSSTANFVRRNVSEKSDTCVRNVGYTYRLVN